MIGYLYIFGCVFFTVYGQLVIKWRMNKVDTLPPELLSKFVYLIKLMLTDGYVFSGFLSAFIASLCWMVAMTKFQISFAYPFMSSAFVLVLFMSVTLLGETLNVYKISGCILIILGIIVLSQGYTEVK